MTWAEACDALLEGKTVDLYYDLVINDRLKLTDDGIVYSRSFQDYNEWSEWKNVVITAQYLTSTDWEIVS